MLLALLATPALATTWESPEVPLHFEHDVNVFQGLAYDTGWLPSGSPVAIAFRITSDGGAHVEMDGRSTLTWPPQVTHAHPPEPGTGLLELNTDLGVSVDLQIDVFDVVWQDQLFGASTNFSGMTTFDPWLLPDGRPSVATVIAELAGTNLLTWDFELLQGVSVAFSADLYPTAYANLWGVEFTTDDRSTLSTIDQTAGTETLSAQGQAQLDLTTLLTVAWEAVLSLVLVPTVEVCVDAFNDCYEVARFDVPIDLSRTTFESDLPTLSYSHPLPLLDIPITEHDFGDVPLGSLRTLELSIGNLGQLAAEGDVVVEQLGPFGVFPDFIYVAPGQADGIVVSFEPTVAGPASATLRLTTSDPNTPEALIELRGNGWVEGGTSGTLPTGGEGPDGEEPLQVIHSETGCGCGGASPAGVLLALVGVGAVASRRRSVRNPNVV